MMKFLEKVWKRNFTVQHIFHFFPDLFIQTLIKKGTNIFSSLNKIFQDKILSNDVLKNDIWRKYWSVIKGLQLFSISKQIFDKVVVTNISKKTDKYIFILGRIEGIKWKPNISLKTHKKQEKSSIKNFSVYINTNSCED